MHHGPELAVVLIAAIALAVGAAVRLLAARTRFPYTIAMMLVGLGAGILLRRAEDAGGTPHLLALVGHGAHISPDLILFAFLPALVFESAYAIDVHTFRKNLGPIIVYAVPALILSTVLVAAAMVGITGGSWGWGWPAALVFGALISATDPVAVVAILRELGVSKRLSILIEGESLLNDGTAIVVFSVLLAGLTGQSDSFDAGGAALSFLWVVSGGVAVGLVLALLLSTWIEKLFNDPLSEITLTIVLAYASMIVAEGVLHVSGVMAVVVAGLWMSGVGRTKVSPEVSHFLHRFWGTLGYIANTLIFFLVGLVIAEQVDRATLADLGVVAAAYVAVMIVRFIVTFLSQPAASSLSDPINSRESAVISWGGLRGAVSLALGLMISQRQEIDPTLRRQILFVTAGVVLSTILVNGATMGKVLTLLGFSRAPLGERLALLTAKARVLADVKDELSELGGARELATVPWHEVMANVERRCTELETNIEEARAELAVAPKAVRAAGEWTRVLSLERQAYWEAFSHGTLGAAAVQLLSKEIDLQLDRLGRGELEAPEERLPTAALRPTLWERFGGGGGFERLALLYDLARAQSRAAESVLTVLDQLGEIDATVAAEVRRTYRRYLVSAKERIEDVRTNLPEVARAIETRLARRIELNLERDGIHELVHRGVLNEAHAELEQGAVEAAMRRLRSTATRVPLPETAELVAQAPLFRGLDAAALSELAEVTEEMVLPKGDILFKKGDAGDSAYVIARGAVHVVVKEGGKEVVVDALGGGEIIGEMALLTGAPRSAMVRAATTVTLGRIRRDSFQHLIQTQPALRDAVWQEVGQRGFDNALRGTRFGSLDRDTRRDWLERATRVELAAGESHTPDPRSTAVFVLLGAVQVGDEAARAGTVVSLDQRRLRVAQDSVVYLLPELAAVAQ